MGLLRHKRTWTWVEGWIGRARVRRALRAALRVFEDVLFLPSGLSGQEHARFGWQEMAGFEVSKSRLLDKKLDG